MQIEVNFADALPIYRQVGNQIRYLMAVGMLETGALLPSIRELALKLEVAPNTIAKAYEELEAAGLAHKRRGIGTFVAMENTQMVYRERQLLIEQRIDALLAEALRLNFSPEALLELMHRRQTKGPVRSES